MNIMLACASGMSTSLLVNKMKDASKVAGREDIIWAIPQSDIEDQIKDCDVLLLGPQMKFLKPKIEPIAKEAGVPLDVIPVILYGRVDGKGVLELADKLVNNN